MRAAVVTLVTGLLVCTLTLTGAAPVMSTDILAPYTTPPDPSLRPWTVYLPLDDPTVSIGADAAASEPTQVHLTISGNNSVYVMWATGDAVVGTGALTANQLTPSMVMYGTSPNNLNLMANGTAATYDQIYPSNETVDHLSNGMNYTSPVLHTVNLTSLTPNTTYYYQVGDGTTMSATYSFRSMAANGTAAYPQRIAFIADWGYSYNSSTTLQHILASVEDQVNPPAIFYIGDYCYADGWLSNGTESPTSLKSAVGYEANASETYQPVWDAWMRFLEPLVSQVPMIGTTGNHEIEEQYDAANTIFASVQARWPVTPTSGNYFYHSANFGPVHGIFLSPYVDYTPGSPQWQWLLHDMSTLNRTAYPWVIVNFHNPWYTTDSSYKQMEQMRVSLEPITYQYGADVFYYGHVHAYERTTPVYNYLVDPCGAVHITIGDGGNSEGLSDLAGTPPLDNTAHNYEDTLGGCPNVTASTRYSSMVEVDGNTTDHFSYYRTVLTFQADGNSTGPPGLYPNGYCYKEQPIWSQYRESSFGHGTLDIINSTVALWSWHRNQDSEAVATDQTYIVRNTQLCPNKLGSAGISSGMQNPTGLNVAAGVMPTSAGR